MDQLRETIEAITHRSPYVHYKFVQLEMSIERFLERLAIVQGDAELNALQDMMAAAFEEARRSVNDTFALAEAAIDKESVPVVEIPPAPKIRDLYPEEMVE